MQKTIYKQVALLLHLQSTGQPLLGINKTYNAIVWGGTQLSGGIGKKFCNLNWKENKVLLQYAYHKVQEHESYHVEFRFLFYT